MPGLIPEEFIADLRNRVDIVDYIRGFIPLKKQGQNYLGLCPFHTEKTPSFVVSPHKQIFHCFGCGKGGNVFSFIMAQKGYNFPEAVIDLANHCGLTIPEKEMSPEKARWNSLKKKFYHINELAAGYFQEQLYKNRGKGALHYLKQRGLSAQICRDFSLGYAPNAWNELGSFLLTQGVAEGDLLTLGLVVKGQNGSLVDRFRNRLIFPLTDPGGKIIGFGGRVLDDSLPKYLNSPETPLFSKGRQLYGLNRAIGSIRNHDQIILMEGYLDVITAHQYGITQAVGTLGTALTEWQGKLLMRYTYNAVICFDADSAGQEAAGRGLDVLQQLGIQVTVMTMPTGRDPDEFLRKEGQTSFKQLIKQAYPYFEYNLLQLMEKYQQDTVADKTRIIQELIPFLAQTGSPVQREGYIRVLAKRLSFSEKAIYAEIKKNQRKRFKEHESTKTEIKIPEQEITAGEKAQKVLLHLLLEKPEFIPQVEKMGGQDLFYNRLYQDIYQTYFSLRKAGHNIEVEDLIIHLAEEKAKQAVTGILLADDLLQDGERVYEDCLTTLKIEWANRKIEEKQMLIVTHEKNGDVSKSLMIMAEVQEMIKERQRLVSTLAKGGNSLEK